MTQLSVSICTSAGLCVRGISVCFHWNVFKDFLDDPLWDASRFTALGSESPNTGSSATSEPLSAVVPPVPRSGFSVNQPENTTAFLTLLTALSPGVKRHPPPADPPSPLLLARPISSILPVREGSRLRVDHTALPGRPAFLQQTTQVWVSRAETQEAPRGTVSRPSIAEPSRGLGVPLSPRPPLSCATLTRVLTLSEPQLFKTGIIITTSVGVGG